MASGTWSVTFAIHKFAREMFFLMLCLTQDSGLLSEHDSILNCFAEELEFL